jgi:hypothetical protein
MILRLSLEEEEEEEGGRRAYHTPPYLHKHWHQIFQDTQSLVGYNTHPGLQTRDSYMIPSLCIYECFSFGCKFKPKNSPN